jgi:hypothetical protein
LVQSHPYEHETRRYALGDRCVRIVQGYSIGSYYKLGSPQAGLNANPMRGLVYLVTNQRKEPIPSTIQHPMHPSNQMVRLETPASAYSYVADILSVQGRDVRAALGITRPNIALVPVPAPNIMRQNRMTDRWPARELAVELERLGFGKVRQCFVHKESTRPRFSYEEDPAHEIVPNLVNIGRPLPSEAVVYVDDLVLSGDRVAALDYAFGQPPGAGVITTAFADEKTKHDAYRARMIALSYDSASTPWKISLL